MLMGIIATAQTLCSPQFTWSQTSNTPSFQVTVTNTSTGSSPVFSVFTSYNMYWGDNTTTTIGLGNTVHTYTNPGNYYATLQMTSYDSLTQTVLCTDTIGQWITVTQSPCGSSISTVNNGGGSYTFNASSNSGIISYSWNFGDGSPAAIGASVNHTYSTSGVYTVTLTTTGGGATCTATTTVNYFNGTVNCANLNANFTSNINGFNVQFNNTSSAVNNGSVGIVNSSSWDFGDGNTSNVNFPSHTYATAGSYVVTLINNWIDSANQNVYCTDSISQLITVSTPPNVISGNITWDSTNSAMTISSTFKVWLITFDSSTNIITAVDSLITSGINGQTTYTFNNEPSGIYRVKAAVVNGTPLANMLAPTYHFASTYWGNAMLINHTGGSSINKHIHMQAGTSTNGPGFISGNVTQGAGKGTATGVPNLLVILRNASNQMVAFTYTDINGIYSFGNIPMGTYNVYPENMPQVTTPSTPFIIQSGSYTISNIDFEKTSTQIKPKTTNVEILTSNTFAVFPNPVSDNVTINWSKDWSGTAQMSIVDMTGRVVMQNNLNTSSVSTINLQSLTSGVYFIKINSGKQQHTEKLIIQK